MQDLQVVPCPSAPTQSNDTIRVQGRTLTLGGLSKLQGLIDRHPQWSRHRLAQELCQRWAWQCAPRDRYVGWSEAARRAHRFRIANPSRFLILPWVVVPHWASHMLGQLV